VAAQTDKYFYEEIDLGHIRNKQEERVAKMMREYLPQLSDFCGCRLCVEDVFALTMNALPPHYIQRGGMALGHSQISAQDIKLALGDAVDKVTIRPNHT